jgi:D-lactate dehydrogenase (cytochrome)
MPDAFLPPADFAQRLGAIVGPENLSLDPATRALMSEDIYAQGGLAAYVIAPASVDELSRVLAAANEGGHMVVPRGGGMSYTSGYVGDREGAVVIDMRRMDKIISVNAEDMYVTVQAGTTWADLRAALHPKGLRTPFWGPLSGISSTIGGGLSQQNAFFGAGVWGTTSDSVLAITVVLADGSIVRTGSAGTTGASPFFRNYGPDLTGLFCGDTGALGMKAEITLRLIPEPAHEGWLSFAMPDLPATARATAAIARTGLACEVCSFDPNLAKIRMRRASLVADAKTLAAVVTSQKNIFEGVKQGAKMALAGRSFMDDAGYTLHVITEGASKAQVEEALVALRTIMKDEGGHEIENTIPKAMRAAPFTPLNNILGPDGERWVPIHGIVPLSHGEACWRELEAMFESRRADLDALKITTGYLVTTVSTTGFLIEPVFFWPGARFGLHEQTVEGHYLKKLPKLAHDEAAAAFVADTREKILDIFEKHGATHFQIGRTYRYAQTRDPMTLALLKALKAYVDPKGLMNPGALGL